MGALKVPGLRLGPRNSCGDANSLEEEMDSNPSALSNRKRATGLGLSLLEQPWTADERTAPNIKSQQTVRLAGDTDPDALPDFAGIEIIVSEP